MPGYTSELDYEGELAVVIGSEARTVPVDRALEHVFGYAVMDDVSARDRQRAEPQWVRAKGGDTFAPFGPWITTADEVPDPQALRIRTWVNGDLRQDGNTADMVFPVAELVSYCSAQFTLEPGDVITTGTPAGVGMASAPEGYLRPGDRVRIEIDGLGAIEHDVVEG
jgi:5-carboxymethyl-2-hydroxymuconate isomerase